jgi:hypothetical protein
MRIGIGIGIGHRGGRILHAKTECQIRNRLTVILTNLAEELSHLQGGCNEAVPKPLPSLVTRIVVWFSGSTLTIVFPFKRCEKARFQSIFRRSVVSELKIRVYHFFMEEIRSV